MRKILKSSSFVCFVSWRSFSFKVSHAAPVITVPKYLEPKLKVLKKKLEQQEEEVHLQRVRRGNSNIVVVSSKKNPQLNHYLGQTYYKDKIQLATESWKKIKMMGDELIFHAFSSNKVVEDLKNTIVEFSSLGLSSLVLEGIQAMNYKKPVEIQQLAIPEILSKKNVLITAETGCGKTLAYVAPLIDQIRRLKEQHSDEDRKKSPFGVIIVPNRELALQIGTVASTLGTFCGVGVAINVGGLPLHVTHTGHDLLVSTAGILSSHIHRRVFNLRRVKTLVLDEADTLLDDSFFNDYIMDVFDAIKFNDKLSAFAAQLILVSATIPSNFDETLQNVVDVESITRITTSKIHHVMPHVRHIFRKIKGTDRGDEILNLARKNMKSKNPTIIFVNRTAACNFLYHHLNDHEIPCVRLNKSVPDEERIESMRKFQSGECNILVCTDIASRGIDSRHVTRIINHDCPHHVADYIHRSGRTGRVGSQSHCSVTSFVSFEEDVEMVQQLEFAVRKQSMIANVQNNIKRMRNEQGNLQHD